MLFESPDLAISWRTPTPARSWLLRRMLTPLIGAPRPKRTMLSALHEYGLPSAPGTPQQELIAMLRCAAAIEHGLMVQYLYSAYSAAQPEARGTVAQVAIEEMGHLLAVQNLLLASASEPCLERYDWQASAPLVPFVFSMEPMSKHSAAKYAVCEMPDECELDPEDKPHLPAILADAKGAAGDGPTRVGLLYMKIYWLLRADDAVRPDGSEPWPGYPVEEVAAEVGPNRHVGSFPIAQGSERQAAKGDWDRYQPTLIVREIDSRDAALKAVAELTAQGEGFGSGSDGHFDRLLGNYLNVAASPSPSRPVLTDPWHDGSFSQGNPAARIAEAGAAGMARLSDQLYELSLVVIALHLALSRTTHAAKRRSLATRCLDLMMAGLKTAGDTLLELEVSAGSTVRASLCFGRPHQDVASDLASLQVRAKALVAEAIALCDALSTPDMPVDVQVAAPGIRDNALVPLQSELAF